MPTEDRGAILLVSSAGGVLLDLVALKPWWSRHERVWAAVRAVDTETLLAGERVCWIGARSIRRPLAAAGSFADAWRVLRAERPTLIVSAGSGPAVAFFLLGRLLGIPSLWLSTLNLVASSGLSARICARLASKVLLQQSSMAAVYPRGIVIGELY